MMNAKQNGFTLLQMVLYVAMVSLVTFATAQLLVTLQATREDARVIAEVESQGAYLMDLIAQEVRNAEAVTAPTPGTSLGSLTLDVVDVADDPTVFNHAVDALTITQGTGSAVALSSDAVAVTSFTAENLTPVRGPGSVRVTFTLTFDSTSTRNAYQYEETFTTTISLR